MNIEKCYEYFNFLNSECDKYLSDKIVNEEELLKMQSELKRFKSLVNNSNLSLDIKTTIEKVTLKYEVTRKTKFIKFLNMIVFGHYTSYYHLKKMKESITDFKSQVLDTFLLLKLKSNHSNFKT
ncbi:hypothetical protein [Wenyingzhuangia sp. IMCC45467]